MHELAHALVRLDRSAEDPSLGYAEEELVVESVAFSVCGGLGINMTGASIPYLASWAEQAPPTSSTASPAAIENVVDAALPDAEVGETTAAIKE